MLYFYFSSFLTLRFPLRNQLIYLSELSSKFIKYIKYISMGGIIDNAGQLHKFALFLKDFQSERWRIILIYILCYDILWKRFRKNKNLHLCLQSANVINNPSWSDKLKAPFKKINAHQKNIWKIHIHQIIFWGFTVNQKKDLNWVNVVNLLMLAIKQNIMKLPCMTSISLISRI